MNSTKRLVMSAPNGLPSPSTTHPDSTNRTQTIGKRKRADDADEVEDSGLISDNDPSSEKKKEYLEGLLHDILEVLKTYVSLGVSAVFWGPASGPPFPDQKLIRGRASREDTIPSTLDCPFVPSRGAVQASKRTKLVEPGEKTTIASLIQSDAYRSVDELIADVDTVTFIILEDIQAKSDGINPMRQPLSHKDQERLLRVSAFKKELRNILLREMAQRPDQMPTVTLLDDGFSNPTLSNGVNGKRTVQLGSSDGSNGVVLTLYGNAPQPKQLFSSLQKPTHITANASTRAANGGPIDDATRDFSSVEVFAPLRETALPNGISTTKIIPVPSTELGEGKQHAPTIGDLFAPSAGVPPLNPPRPSKLSATRSASVTWFNPAEAASSTRSHRRETYTSQPLSTGQWLTYNVAPSPTQLASPEAKRKQRDRALSIGEPRPTLPQEVMVAHQQAKEDALFRSAYSSFAPSRDDAAALIPEAVKNRLWWRRVGEQRFHEMFPRSTFAEQMDDTNDVQEMDDAREDEIFRQAAESWVPEELPAELKEVGTTEKESKDKDTDEILSDISELLQTLNSYQHLRNLSLTPTSRTAAGQNPQLTTLSGSPDSPSLAEFDVYNILKSQLALLIGTLPPYAVSKLNGDRMGALNISTKLQMEAKSYKGTMEEDEITAKARQATLTAAASSAARTTTPSVNASSRSHYPQSINTPSQPSQRSNYATQAPSSRPASLSASYHPQSYTNRPPSTSNHYASYPTQRPPSSTPDRHSYTSQQYSQQTPAHPSQYTQNGQRQPPLQNGYTYGQYGTPQAGAQGTPIQGQQYQRPSQPGYQQRAQNAHNYNYSGVNSGRSGSPQKASTYTPQPRPSYPAQSQSPNQQRSPHYQAPTQYASQNSAVAQLNTAAAAANYHMTADEQAMLMNRQKAQLAQQITTNPPRQGSGTPQPAPGQFTGGQNGTPAPQQNGVTVGQGQE